MSKKTGQLKARYFKADGKAGKAFALPDDPFDGVVHEDSIYHAIRAYQANQRQGTASAKNRAVIRGGGRKPWRQKGTGRARAGSIRSPIWRGGAVVFPPQSRDFSIDVSKKVTRLARRSAFNARASEEGVTVLESFDIEQPKTRELVKLLEKLELREAKVLILTAGHKPNVYLSARNVPNLQVKPYGDESTYDILWADHVVIEEGALTGSLAEAAAETEAEEKPAASADGAKNSGAAGEDDEADEANAAEEAEGEEDEDA